MIKLFLQIFGHRVLLLLGDTLVMDRWIWLKNNLKSIPKDNLILDVGCGNGSMTCGMAALGFETIGLTWDATDTQKAQDRATILNLKKAGFIIQDARELDKRNDFKEKFDVIVCTENIEHILDDQKLIIDISHCLKSTGRLLLTTPNIDFKHITKDDNGPFQKVELGWHVRRGYNKEGLTALCKNSNLDVLEIGFISGFLSQKITWIFRQFNKIHPQLGGVVITPLRIFPILFDKYIDYTGYSIFLVARKR
mgnify:CR=1 FL=1